MGAGGETGKLELAAFSAVDEGGLLTADPTATGTGDKEEEEQHSGWESGEGACPVADEATSVGVRGAMRTGAFGVPARLEGRIWLLHCALKLDC